MSDSTLHLLDLESRLAADAAGWERDALLTRLRAARAKAKRQLDTGVSPEVYKQLTTLIEACDAALALVPELWRHLRAGAARNRSEGSSSHG
ncbi:MAG TPA: EscE/YscE/SsaE family type III secretion system needle protein co-chaperone [Geminicoccaceae bacterium]|nr:EscE/YscE/SsaE family type III secretion system needle protein co-chaperone [Geminicoccaceae bacterium]